FVLRVCLREQLGQKSTFDSAALSLKELGLETQTFQDYFRAEQYRSRDELEEAIRCYRQVLSAEPQNYWALTGLGHCYLRTGRADLAWVAYQSCIVLQPRSPWPWMQRGVAAGMEGDGEQAEADFLRALGIDREFHPARFNLGLVYAARGEYRIAIEQF